MRCEMDDIESGIFGEPVVNLVDVDGAEDFPPIEREYVSRFDPAYVRCRLPLEQGRAIHMLEDAGFNLVDVQLRMTSKLKGPYDTASTPYVFEAVEDESGLQEVMEIAGSTFSDDRFLNDPGLPDAAERSASRYRAFVRRSFEQPDERVYRLRESPGGRTLAFKTHRIVGAREAVLLLGGVHPECRTAGVGASNEYFEFETLLAGGIDRITTHVSVRNYPIVNLEVRGLRFRVRQAYAVLRKLYVRGSAGRGG